MACIQAWGAGGGVWFSSALLRLPRCHWHCMFKNLVPGWHSARRERMRRPKNKDLPQARPRTSLSELGTATVEDDVGSGDTHSPASRLGGGGVGFESRAQDPGPGELRAIVPLAGEVSVCA